MLTLTCAFRSQVAGSGGGDDGLRSVGEREAVGRADPDGEGHLPGVLPAGRRGEEGREAANPDDGQEPAGETGRLPSGVPHADLHSVLHAPGQGRPGIGAASEAVPEEPREVEGALRVCAGITRHIRNSQRYKMQVINKQTSRVNLTLLIKALRFPSASPGADLNLLATATPQNKKFPS